MVHRLQHIADLVAICGLHGVETVVISPGSRNAPLINAFYRKFGNACISIVDERSAGYVALGIARYTRHPVVIICTSGTAVLNYSPAIAEAYYQRIPMIVITADRPAEWIDQQDNQTIRQKNVYQNFIKKSISLPERTVGEKELISLRRDMQECIQLASIASMGPVHINAPLYEPLYEELPVEGSDIGILTEKKVSGKVLPRTFITQWKEAKKILIVHGQDFPDESRTRAMQALSADPRVVIIAENIANSAIGKMIRNPELMLARTKKEQLDIPDLLIYAGGQVVSKRLKELLRSWKIVGSWRIGRDSYDMDTFRQGNRYLRIEPGIVYTILAKHISKADNPTNFKRSWLSASMHVSAESASAFADLPFSDLSAVYALMEQLPDDLIIELGNSSAIRYSQLLPDVVKAVYYSNRGVSGIDGCLSAAVGTALSTEKPTLVILGDLSFVYDSNALWNRRLPKNIKIVVLNNSGGGIFDLIPGPADSDAFNDFFIARHPVNLQKLAETFYLDYFCVRTKQDLVSVIPEFLGRKVRPVMLEVVTDRKKNKDAFFAVLKGICS